MKSKSALVALIMMIYFVMSFLTNILGPIIPDIIRSFSLTLTLAALLPFSFFIAYGVLSIPAGLLVERFREKNIMAAAFAVAAVAAGSFVLIPRFAAALPSLFAIGGSMAMLQVALNPLLRQAGGEEHFAFNSVVAQLVFGAASFFSPMVYTSLIEGLRAPAGAFALLAAVVPAELPWISLYVIFMIVALVMVAVILAARIPTVVRTGEEQVGAWPAHRALLRRPHVILFFFGIFAYVGTEQGVSNWISQFLALYHGVDPQNLGASVVGWFWGLMTAGCLLGLVLLKLFDSRKILVAFSLAGFLFLTFALFGSMETAVWAFPMIGFAASVMWSIIFSLALNSVPEHHGSFSGILCSGVIGGAFVPVAIGWLGDRFGLRAGMCLLYLTLGYILSVGFWARPLIANATFSSAGNTTNSPDNSRKEPDAVSR